MKKTITISDELSDLSSDQSREAIQCDSLCRFSKNRLLHPSLEERNPFTNDGEALSKMIKTHHVQLSKSMINGPKTLFLKSSELPSVILYI